MMLFRRRCQLLMPERRCRYAAAYDAVVFAHSSADYSRFSERLRRRRHAMPPPAAFDIVTILPYADDAITLLPLPQCQATLLRFTLRAAATAPCAKIRYDGCPLLLMLYADRRSVMRAGNTALARSNERHTLRFCWFTLCRYSDMIMLRFLRRCSIMLTPAIDVMLR